MRHLARAVLASLTTLLVACGQTGPLVLPDAEPKGDEKPTEQPRYQPTEEPAHVKPVDEDEKARRDKNVQPGTELDADPR